MWNQTQDWLLHAGLKINNNSSTYVSHVKVELIPKIIDYCVVCPFLMFVCVPFKYQLQNPRRNVETVMCLWQRRRNMCTVQNESIDQETQFQAQLWTLLYTKFLHSTISNIFRVDKGCIHYSSNHLLISCSWSHWATVAFHFPQILSPSISSQRVSEARPKQYYSSI
jgi:hypothetical protein